MDLSRRRDRGISQLGDMYGLLILELEIEVPGGYIASVKRSGVF